MSGEYFKKGFDKYLYNDNMDNTKVENYFDGDAEPQLTTNTDKGFDERPWEGIPPLAQKLHAKADIYDDGDLKAYAYGIGKIEELIFDLEKLIKQIYGHNNNQN